MGLVKFVTILYSCIGWYFWFFFNQCKNFTRDLVLNVQAFWLRTKLLTTHIKKETINIGYNVITMCNKALRRFGFIFCKNLNWLNIWYLSLVCSISEYDSVVQLFPKFSWVAQLGKLETHCSF